MLASALVIVIGYVWLRRWRRGYFAGRASRILRVPQRPACD
jgi:hypothetical protein